MIDESAVEQDVFRFVGAGIARGRELELAFVDDVERRFSGVRRMVENRIGQTPRARAVPRPDPGVAMPVDQSPEGCLIHANPIEEGLKIGWAPVLVAAHQHSGILAREALEANLAAGMVGRLAEAEFQKLDVVVQPAVVDAVDIPIPRPMRLPTTPMRPASQMRSPRT